jgi:nicotinate-nucleotide adenylyltransferase
MDRLAAFGGTFDPPHYGHLQLAQEAARQLNLDTILWILTPDPPHKKGIVITPWQIRLEMVMAAIKGYPDFRLSRVEIDREPPYYALDTVRLLRSAYPSSKLFYLIGGDSLIDLPKWHKPIDFVESLDFLGVLKRFEYRIEMERLEKNIPGISSKIVWINIPPIEISSSDIRMEVMKGNDIASFVPESVHQVIGKYNLYRGE